MAPNGISVMFRAVLVMVVMATPLCRAAIDQAFCDSGRPVRVGDFRMPTLQDNFNVVTERVETDLTDPRAVTMDLWYSKQVETAKIHLTDYSKGVDTFVWAYGKRDTLIEYASSDKPVCAVSKTDENPEYKYLLFAAGTTMGTPNEVLQLSDGLHDYYLTRSEDLADRDISVNVVSTCSYDSVLDQTTQGLWYFNDPTKTKMPGDPTLILPVRAQMKTIDHSKAPPKTTTQTIDYVNFEYGMDPKHEIKFRPPTLLFCDMSKSVNKKNIPSLEDPFKVRVEKITRRNLDPKGEQDLNTFVYTYSAPLNLFVKEVVTFGTSTDTDLMPTQVDLIVQDFNTQMQFTVNRISGSCAEPTKLNLGKEAFLNPKGDDHGNIASINQFFYLDAPNGYEWLGVKKARNIECDVFTTQNEKFVYYWFFATEEWKNSYGYSKDKPLPVALEEIPQGDSGTFNLYNFYDFNINYDFLAPDISICVDQGKIRNFWFIVTGSYHRTVAPDVPSFRRAIVNDVLAAGKSFLYTRIPTVNFFPWSNNEIAVLVTLIDKLDKGTYSADEPSSEQFVNNLKQQIDGGQFQLRVNRVDGSVVVPAKKQSLKSYDPKKGKPVSPNTGNNGGDNTSSGGQGGGYTGGDMAGLAFGMMFLTALVTLAIVFAVYKFKMAPYASSALSMGKMGDA